MEPENDDELKAWDDQDLRQTEQKGQRTRVPRPARFIKLKTTWMHMYSVQQRWPSPALSGLPLQKCSRRGKASLRVEASLSSIGSPGGVLVGQSMSLTHDGTQLVQRAPLGGLLRPIRVLWLLEASSWEACQLPPTDRPSQLAHICLHSLHLLHMLLHI